MAASEVPLQRPGIDQGLGFLPHEMPQATPPVAGLVVPSTAIDLTRFLAMSIRWTSEGPS
jgi:hypothetical protein